MATLVNAIAAHAVVLWVMVPVLAALTTDLLWQCRMHRRKAAVPVTHARIRPHTVAMVGCLAALMFGIVALMVGSGSPPAVLDFDTSLAAAMHARLPPSALPVLSSVSRLGSTPWVAALSVMLLLIIMLRREWRLATCWAVAQLGILPITHAIKVGFRRVRPPHDLHFVSETSWSFPSGHAVGAVVFYGMLACVLLRLLPVSWQRWMLAACIFLAGLVGLSRILLQAHYLSDVVAGYLCGTVWLMLCIALAGPWQSPASANPGGSAST